MSNRHIFLDTDFLIKLSEDEDLFKNLFTLFPGSHLTIEPFVKLEFLLGNSNYKQLLVREKMIGEADVFYILTNQHEVFSRLQTNVLILSRIYKHQALKRDIGKSCSPSTVDLILAARVMSYHASSFLVTGNRKDFNAAIFKLIGVINVEDKGGMTRCFSILKFDIDSFRRYHSELESEVQKSKTQKP